MSVFHTLRATRLSIGRSFRSIKGKIYSGITALSGFKSYVPERLVIAPHDLHTADAIIAQEFYNGKYTLGGETIQTNSVSPFLISTKNQAWIKELHSFTWLLHFSANKDILSDSHARILVRNWIELKPEQTSKWAWEIETTSKRLISFICHSIVLLGKPDPDFHTLLMRSLGKHIKILKREIINTPDGQPRLLAHIALAYAAITFDGHSTSLENTAEKLGLELQKQILPDGGHISRNPEVIPEILALLLPLKQGYMANDLAPPEKLLSAIERLMPALKFFRHGDGTLARFNGVGVTQKDLISTLLRYDESLGEPIKDAIHSGYQRANLGTATLIFDTGEPAKGELSICANAGALSFEFSDGLSSIIVNCGKPAIHDKDASQVWRTTNAHSTVTLNNTSSSRFENPGTAGRAISGQIFANNLKMEYAREDTSTSSTITASHSGYVREFGIRYQRSLTLDSDGNRLLGQEWFSDPNKGNIKYTTKDNIALRFHLHPNIKASLASNSETCLLETLEGEQWRFDCPGFKVELVESIFFATLPRPRTAWQMVIHTKAYDKPEINWALQKIQAKEAS